MNAKKLIVSTQENSTLRKISRIAYSSAISTFGLLASQAVYAADEASSGVPGWVWGLLVIGILVGVTLLPKKWIDPKKAKNLGKNVPTPAPTAKVTTPEVKQATPEVKVAPVAKEVIRDVVEPIKEVAPVEKPVEVIDALVEAKQLINQQRFPQAVGILNKGLQKDPARSDLMLELLAIYLKQNNHEEFDALFEQLKELDDPLALIQAEELHDQLVRPVVAEDSDLIEYDAKKAAIVVTEPEAPTTAPDYSADSLVFTSEKSLIVDEQVSDVESEPFSKTADITPSETEFSLDDISLEPSPVAAKETTIEVSAKATSDDFDFSEFDDFIIHSPSEAKSIDTPEEPAPIEPTPAPVAEVAEIKAPVFEAPSTDLLDLEFDLDDNFALDDDKTEESAKKAEWTTDLADETFVTPVEPATPAFNDPFATEVAPEPVVPAPVAPPKPVAPVVKDLATTLEEEFPFLQTADTFQTRLDLARNYIALGEITSAKELLNEVIAQGAGSQQTEARELIAKLAS